MAHDLTEPSRYLQSTVAALEEKWRRREEAAAAALAEPVAAAEASSSRFEMLSGSNPMENALSKLPIAT